MYRAYILAHSYGFFSLTKPRYKHNPFSFQFIQEGSHTLCLAKCVLCKWLMFFEVLYLSECSFIYETLLSGSQCKYRSFIIFKNIQLWHHNQYFAQHCLLNESSVEIVWMWHRNCPFNRNSILLINSVFHCYSFEWVMEVYDGQVVNSWTSSVCLCSQQIALRWSTTQV